MVIYKSYDLSYYISEDEFIDIIKNIPITANCCIISRCGYPGQSYMKCVKDKRVILYLGGDYYYRVPYRSKFSQRKYFMHSGELYVKYYKTLNKYYVMYKPSKIIGLIKFTVSLLESDVLLDKMGTKIGEI